MGNRKERLEAEAKASEERFEEASAIDVCML